MNNLLDSVVPTTTACIQQKEGILHQLLYSAYMTWGITVGHEMVRMTP